MANNTNTKTLIDTAAARVIDKEFIRWSKSDWLRMLHDAYKAVLVVRPDAYTLAYDFSCAAGVEQKLEDDTNLLLNVMNNVGGKSVRGPQDMLLLDNYRPSWRNDPEMDQVDCYMYDERVPQTFYVYPPAKVGLKLRVITSKVPEAPKESDYDGDKPSFLAPIFDNPVVEYMVYQAFSEDNEFAANANKAQLALNSFQTLLGLKNSSDAMNATSYQRDQVKAK